MDKLKTLKDLKIAGIIDYKTGNSQKIKETDLDCCSLILKQEAIKWIKEEIKILSSGEFNAISSGKSIQRWSKRFNISEEDLK